MNPRKDLLGIEDLKADEIFQYLDLADNFLEVLARPIPIVPQQWPVFATLVGLWFSQPVVLKRHTH